MYQCKLVYSYQVRFNNEEDLKKELVSMDQLFDVE